MVVYKYCASGNDFLIFHSFVKKNYQQLAQALCNRFSGIGADGLVVLLPNEHYAYEWDFYNADGSYASMCGNASRCVAHYAYSLGLAPKAHSFLSGAGEIRVNVEGLIVSSNLGAYKALEFIGQIQEYDMQRQWYFVDTGVPHLVCFVESSSHIPTQKTKLMKTLRERYNANVNFAYKIDSQTLQVCTYERGVEDITLACGTGMAASGVIGNRFFGLEQNLKVIPPSREAVEISIKDNDKHTSNGKDNSSDDKNKGCEVYLKGAIMLVGICQVADVFDKYLRLDS